MQAAERTTRFSAERLLSSSERQKQSKPDILLGVRFFLAPVFSHPHELTNDSSHLAEKRIQRNSIKQSTLAKNDENLFIFSDLQPPDSDRFRR